MKDCSQKQPPTRETRQLLEIVANAHDAIVSADERFRITHFNQAAERLFGYDSQEIVGKPINLLLPEEDRGIHAKLMSQFSADKERKYGMGGLRSVHGRTKDGRQIPLEISIFRHDEPGPRRFTAIARDISDQIAAQESLRESERKFRAIFNGSYHLVALLDTQGRLLKINNRARSFVGQQAQENWGETFWSCPWWLDETDFARVNEAVVAASKGRSGRAVVRAHGRKGRSVHVDLSVTPITGSKGEISFLVAEGRDITRLMEMNEALRKSEASLAQAQRIAKLGNWDWDIEKDVLRWSDEIFRILGAEPGSFGTSRDAFTAFVHPDDREALRAAARAALRNDEPFSIVHRLIALDGREKIVHERGEVIRNDSGQPIFMSGTVQDVTETRHRERELAEAKERAEAANRAKSQFLATMSHELRTPLNAIIGFSELIEAQSAGPIAQPQYVQYANYVSESGRHLLSVINDILDVSRVELGAIEPHWDYFDPNALVEMVVHMLSHRAQSKEIELSATLTDGDVEVVLDERLCRQILINLANNAIKFCHTGGAVEVGVRTEGRDAVFYVNDNGPGIAQECLENIFQPFYQAEEEYARRHEGVGLGLTIVKKFTELQGGAVSVTSEPGVLTSISARFFDCIDERGCLASSSSR